MIANIAAILLTQGKPNYAPESNLFGPSGQFLIRRPGIDESIYRLAEADLQSTNIMAIVRRKGKVFQVWNMDGQLLNPKFTEIPDRVADQLTEGRIAIQIKQPFVPVTIESPRHQYQFELQKVEPWFKYIDVWGIVSVRDVQYVDIPFAIKGKYVIGSFGPNVGASIQVDGIKYEIKDEQKFEKTDITNSRRVFQEKGFSPFGHYLGIEYDRARFIADNPNDLSYPIVTKFCVKEKQSSDVPEGVNELFISGDKPIRYWNHITVIRIVQIDAVVKRVPTKPKGN